MWQAVDTPGPDAGGGAAPCGRGKHAAAVLGRALYVAGGRGAGGALPLRDFWRYDLERGSWERLGARGTPPPALQEHTATAHGSRLYVFGGEVGAAGTEVPLWVYDTESEVWSKLAGPASPSGRRAAGRATGRAGRAAAEAPRGRRGHSAHALNDCLLIYGGYRDLRGSTNELWAFHYESSTWQLVRTARAGPARHRHGAALLGARLYVHGGRCDLAECADLHYYDTISHTWHLVRAGRAAPGARAGHAATAVGDWLYVFGGEAGGAPLNDLWRFHTVSEMWERIEHGVNWPSPRVDSAVLLLAAAPARLHPAARPVAAAAAAGAAGAAAGAAGGGLLARLAGLQRRRARCAYSALPPESPAPAALVRSRSVHARQEPREADTAGWELAREPLSMPDFARLPAPLLTPAQASKLVYLDSDEEDGLPRERVELRPLAVRFTRAAAPGSVAGDAADDGDTSGYASTELGFCNPHYGGPDVRAPPPAAPALLLVGGKEPTHLALLQRPLSLWVLRPPDD